MQERNVRSSHDRTSVRSRKVAQINLLRAGVDCPDHAPTAEQID